MGILAKTASVIVTLFALGSAHAQPKYSQIEVGTVLTDSIGMGFLTKSLPLPPGQWEVVGKTGGEAGVSGGITQGVTSTATLTITAKNNAEGDPLVAIVVSFYPDSLPLIFNNGKCDLGSASHFDALDTRAGGTLYACALVFPGERFRSFVAQAPNSTAPGVKESYSALAPYAASLPEEAIGVVVRGSRDYGRRVNYVMFLKKEGDFLKDAAYATYVKDWVHAAGIEIKNYLDNGSARIPPLQPYKAN